MAIDFTPERWDIVKENYTKWWNGELNRPIVRATAEKKDAPPWKPVIEQNNCHDFSVSPDEIAAGIEYDISREIYYADSFPYYSLVGFGPGVLAAFCGAKLDNSSGAVWFYPDKERDISEIHVEYDPNNRWAVRVKDIYHAVNKRIGGQVMMGMVDLGGFLDVLATFRTTEKLLFDLYDNPKEVRRVCVEIEEAWFKAYDDLNSVIQEKNPGYTDWYGLYSATPSYITQSDFSYMIGPDMFREFALPELSHACDRLDNVIYHLDGKGEIPHLDMLLGIEKLKAIQWVAGDGAPLGVYWMDLYRKIRDGGKNFDVCGIPEDVMKIKETLGGKGMSIGLWGYAGQGSEEGLLKFIDRLYE